MDNTTCIYLTSKNSVKEQVVKEFLTSKYNLICVESDSEISGGQPYGYDETLLGCKNRTKQFKGNQNYISIENGFVTSDENTIYDIAIIIININGQNMTALSNKRYFPIELLDISDINTRTKALEAHFKKNNETRYTQLKDTINKFKIYFD
jgi:non-canonical (house-cleaning) NTP pyrophosphatase|tara:strand:- start:217 stop:669 length:453 start_codon:yes stop_codon:yes gene_type:complete